MTFKYKNVYEPEEDSKLLLKHTISELKAKLIGNKNKISLCEVGVGSGYVISNIAKLFPSLSYFGSDINPDAIKITQEEFNTQIQQVILKNNSLLSGFNKEIFDIILFNTPYFPLENSDDSLENLSMKDRAIYGGKQGYEVTEEFILNANDYLKNDGFIIIIFSSLTNLERIEKILKRNLFEYIILEEENSFFEKIYCFKFYKSEILKKISKLGITNINYLDSGKHSIVLDGNYNGESVIIKIGESQHIEKEGVFEEKMKNESFIPKMYFRESNFVIREKCEGDRIIDFFQKCDLKSLIVVLNRVLEITQRMDELGITKFEMTNPYKHIYVEKNLDIKFIDFERCIYSDKPKNTTQVLQYFRRNIPIFKKIGLILDDKKMFEISKKYKTNNFKFKISDII